VPHRRFAETVPPLRPMAAFRIAFCIGHVQLVPTLQEREPRARMDFEAITAQLVTRNVDASLAFKSASKLKESILLGFASAL
jgi:hypothetical protein